MFLATDHIRSDEAPPGNCGFRESDWHVLAGFWHPVAFAHDVPSDRPLAARLLDLDLVVYRTTAGITVAEDRCPHRGTRLSGGWLRDDLLICPMHGLHFDGAGRCRKIPSIGDPNPTIPAKLCLRRFQAVEHHGLIWTCLKPEPLWPLPQWEGIGDPALTKVFVPSDTWQASAARHVENFNDLAHFPFVHLGSFGDDDATAFPLYKVAETDDGLAFSVPYVEGGNRFPDCVEGDKRAVTYSFRLTFPFSTLLVVDPEGSDFVHYFADTVCPVSAGETKIFQQLTDTTGDPDGDYWIKDSLLINDEDKPLVEGQQPMELPLDLAAEIHIPADRLSVAYRRALSGRFGLGAPAQGEAVQT